MNAACAVCHTTTEPLTASGLCGTCQSQASETKAAPPDEFAPTATGEPALDTLSAATTDTSDSLLPPGGYELIEEVGAGGMGLVWKARRLSTGQFVAIKKLQPKCFTPTGFKRFVAEARAIESVDHLNVVRLLDFVPDPADPFLVLEYVPGKNLVDLLKESGPFHPDRAARVLVDICHGVQAAHDKGIVHRDLKPNNVLLTPNGRVKVTDFGLTKSVAEAGVLVAAGGGADDSPEHADTLTRTGHTAGGTPGYLAPEQADATFAPIDRRADVWGAGATLFTLIVGRPPFAGGKENMRRVLTDPLVPPHEIDPRVPRDLSEIVVRCLQKQPADRYPSAAAVADDLTKFLNRDSTAARPQPWVQRQWRRARGMSRWTVVGWALAAAVVVVGISLAMVPKPTPVVAAALPTAPVDPRTRQREQFLSGQEVVLVPKKGRPEWHEWVDGYAEVTDSLDHEGAAYIRPFTVGAVKLFDPPIDSYRVSADIRHLSPQDDKDDKRTWAGVMLFHQRMEKAGGAWADTYLTLDYRDWDNSQMPGKPAIPQPLHVYLRHQATERPGGRSTSGSVEIDGNKATFVTGIVSPGRWRRVVAEVTPARVRLYFGDVSNGDAGLILVADFSAAQLTGSYRSNHDTFKFLMTNPAKQPGELIADPTLIPNGWPTTGGFGLYATRSGLAFRNVTVRPFSPAQE